MRSAGARYHYPLVGVYAHRFVAPRFALIGDAAVGMHPVTAHGCNFGLYGVELLARELKAARAADRDIGALATLQPYESTHRRATLPVYLATNAIVSLFTDERRPAKLARRIVLAVAERADQGRDHAPVDGQQHRVGIPSLTTRQGRCSAGRWLPVRRERLDAVARHYQLSIGACDGRDRDHRRGQRTDPKIVAKATSAASRPVAKRAGMLTARHSAIIRCAKSRHTPTCSSSVSIAEVCEFEVFDEKLVRSRTQARIPWTRL
jgi:hypothetical protein